MRNTVFYTIMMLFILAFSSCQATTKSELAASRYEHFTERYHVVDPANDEPTMAQVATEIEKTGLWPIELINYVLVTEELTSEEKYRYLVQNMSGHRNVNEGNIETIARKFSTTGNVNSNGSNAFWDCSPDLFAQTIAQLGQPCDERAINNYFNGGNSATSITLSDVLRAANGVNNQSFNTTIEVVDLVFEFELSGGNWIVGAVILYEGEEYLFSEITGDSGGLIYDPQEGGTYLIGPMPGGIVSVNVTGIYDAPDSADNANSYQ